MMRLDATSDTQLRGHLHMIHGIYVNDVKSTAGLRQAHTYDHESGPIGPRITHTHSEGARP